jgi:hypothetical protein
MDLSRLRAKLPTKLSVIITEISGAELYYSDGDLVGYTKLSIYRQILNLRMPVLKFSIFGNDVKY